MCGRFAAESGAPRLPPLAPDRHTLFAGLYRSYLRCRRTKRRTMNALRFEFRAELNLLELTDELAEGRYRPSRSIRFAVERPKMREIVAAAFRDRVVHHYLVERLERIFEPIFIHDSYACRVGKGVHAALERVREFLRSGTENGRRPLYSLHLDVKNFFMTIDHRTLVNMVEERLVKEARRVGAHGMRPDTLERDPSDSGARRAPLPFLFKLAKTIIHHNHMTDRLDKDDLRILERIPPHKTLLHAPFGKGLPVGNLTSQFFANVYLNELDQFCKHVLKCRYYVRYCDDFLILDRDPERLAVLREEIRGFLRQRLSLELNTRYAAIVPVTSGIDFIGYIIRPDYVLVRRRTVNNLRARLEEFQRTQTTERPGMLVIRNNPAAVARLRGVLASYTGHFLWADTHRLRRSLFQRYPFIRAFFRMDAQGAPVFKRGIRPEGRTLRGQCRSLAGRYPGAAVYVQVGRRYHRPGLNHGGAVKGVGAARLQQAVRERLKAGLPVVIAWQTGRRYGQLLERLPAVFLLPRRDS